MNLLRKLMPADYVTLLAVALITISFWFLAKGELHLASASALAAIFFDFIDGKIARKYGSSQYGKYLDSLFDVAGFIIFPTLLIITVRQGDLASLIVSIVYSLAAYLRLARFTVHGLPKSAKYYQGMPVLYSVFAILLYRVDSGTLSLLVLLAMSPLMISDLKVPKPNHPVYGLILIISAVWMVYA